tara:strand:+ start:587 stop:793 length:207 start_codon:yes stop_codon:yes gene_type:complete
MENKTPFSDALHASDRVAADTPATQQLAQIDILRSSNHELKLELIELKLKLDKIQTIIHPKYDKETVS